MVITVINWLWAGISFVLTGLLVRSIAGKLTGRYLNKADEVIVSGIIFCTVYAEYVSLFYKVEVLCTLGLFSIDLIAVVVCRKELIKAFGYIKELKNYGWQIFVCMLFGFFFVMASTLKVEHVDTYLYHAQTIEWNELYGAVKGLGNLHPRFAYNSAFFCLQALFSLRGLLGKSLHVLNGLFCLMAVSYSFCTLKFFKTKKLYASDIARMTTFFYVLYSAEYISSPNSDILTLLLVIYVIIKWMDMAESRERFGENEVSTTMFLGIVTVYLVSLKLSAMPLVLLCLYPLYRYVRAKNWKELIFMLLCGTAVIFPFLARNVIQSGYLLYPFPALDLFNFDWEIPAFKAEAESTEIMAWGRSLNYKGAYDWPFGKWIHEWWQYLDSRFKYFVLIDLAAIVCNAVMIIKSIKNKRADHRLFVMVIIMISWLYWFLSAPIIRYGMPFLLLLPAVTLLYMGDDIKKCFAVTEQLFIIAMLINLVMTFDAYNCKIFWPEDYPLNEGVENIIYAPDGSEHVIYSPVEGADLTEYPIYYQFPAVPGASMLKEVEMRGNDLSDGFRYKGE